MAYYNNPGQVNDEAISLANGKTFKVVQLANSFGDIIDPSSGQISFGGLNIPPHDSAEMTYVTSGNGLGEIYQVFYKSSGSTVATLTLGYDSSGRINSYNLALS